MSIPLLLVQAVVASVDDKHLTKNAVFDKFDLRRHGIARLNEVFPHARPSNLLALISIGPSLAMPDCVAP